MARVIAGMASKASIINRPRSASSRVFGAVPPRIASRSKPAQKARPSPPSSSTRSSGSAASQRLAAMISCMACGDSAFSLCGRFRLKRPMPPCTCSSKLSNRGGTGSAIIAA